MNSRITLLTMIMWMFIAPLFADEVPIQQSRQLALNFYQERLSQYQQLPQDFTLSVQSEYIISENGQSLYYIFNMNTGGYIMVAARDEVYPVLAYSFHSDYPDVNKPPALEGMEVNYKKQIQEVIQNNIPATGYIVNTWQHYSSPSFSSQLAGLLNVTPLLTSVWNQGCYFNDSCPADASGPCGHVVTGCVATAMAQVMNYHQHPIQGTGTHSYNHPTYGTLSADFGNTSYNYAAMPDTVTTYAPEVARLIYHCGVSVEMDYSPSASGAGFPVDAFKTYFKYASSTQLLAKQLFTDTIWNALLRMELDSARPLFYVGSGSAGHAFVCDGYQGLDFFHFNWGWGGSHDGYFYLNSLNPGGLNFSVDQSAIFGLKPSSGGCSGLTTLIAPSTSFEDGSGTGNYMANSNCLWLISPPGATSIAITFDSLDLASGDSIYIYDGSSSLSPLIGAYSGNTIPPTLITTDTAAFIYFYSDAAGNAGGFTISYTATMPGLPCSGLSVLTSQTDTISDGSGPGVDYSSYADCKWLIQPAGASSVTLEFLEFQTESGYDFVDIYDGTTTNAPLIGSYSGSTLPPVVSSSDSSMLVHFTSDGALTDSGWKAVFKVCDPAPVITGNPGLSICNGDSAVLSVPAIYQTYTWFFNGAPIIGADSNEITVSDTGLYRVRAVNNCGFVVNSTNTMFNFYPPIPANAGNDTIICIGSCTNLIASGGVAYEWSTGQNTDTINVCPLSDTTFYLTVTDVNGCMEYDSVNLIVRPLPVVGLNAPDTIFCPNDPPVNLQGTPSGGLFSGPGMAGKKFFPANAGPGTHSITYDYSDPFGCSGSETIELTVLNGPAVILTASQAPVFCAGDSVIISATYDSTYIYQWYFNVNPIPQADSTVIVASISGDYILETTDSIGCISLDTVSVNVFAQPNANIGPDSTICYYDSIRMDAGPGQDNYLWSTGETSRVIFATSDPGNLGATDYWVIVTKDGCVAKDSALITFDACTGIEEWMNTFSVSLYPNPNNGEFTILFNDAWNNSYLINIYDIHGRIVYSEVLNGVSSDYQQEILLENIRAGFYMLTIESQTSKQSLKFIIR